MSSKKMTTKDVSRIYSATSKKHGGKIPKGSFAARAAKAISKQLKTS